jgi:hypothetical protein
MRSNREGVNWMLAPSVVRVCKSETGEATYYVYLTPFGTLAKGCLDACIHSALQSECCIAEYPITGRYLETG